MSVKVVEGIIGAIQKRIDEYEEMATDLAHDYIQSDKPFPTDLKQRYNAISEISEGLIEAIGIIMQGDYKQDDENKRLREALEETKSDILSIGEIISIAVGCGETVDLSNLNEKLHEMFLRLDGEQHEPSTD